MRALQSLLLVSVCISCIFGHGINVPMDHVKKYVGQSIGSGANKGQCATGVQTLFFDYYKKWILGLTSTWTRGDKVLGNTNIPVGTAIASFNPTTKKYDCTYGCHAAIYASQDATGIQVYDQWRGKTNGFGKRTLRLKSSGKPQSNQADRFYVIEAPSIPKAQKAQPIAPKPVQKAEPIVPKPEPVKKPEPVTLKTKKSTPTPPTGQSWLSKGWHHVKRLVGVSGGHSGYDEYMYDEYEDASVDNESADIGPISVIYLLYGLMIIGMCMLIGFCGGAIAGFSIAVIRKRI